MIAELPKKLADELRVFSRRKLTPLSISQLYEFGRADSPETRVKAAQFLHTELPIRLAHMSHDLETLPCGLSDMPSVQLIQRLYIQSFKDIVEFDHPMNERDEEFFTDMLDMIKNRHARVVQAMARGVMELKERRGDKIEEDEIQLFLDRFYMSRIGIRVLIGQHIALHEPRGDSKDWVGIICSATSPADVARHSAERALTQCRMAYGIAPEVQIVGSTDRVFTYIPSHLDHMMFELLKNSLRATVEHHSTAKDLPPIKIVVADGEEDVTIKVEDEGGGVPRSGINRIWTYLYTTARPVQADCPQAGEVDPIAGYGFGLPITRLYARYFGGDLQIISMEGYGTDAYLHLNRLGTGAEAIE